MNSPIWYVVIGVAFLGFAPTYSYLMKKIRRRSRHPLAHD